MGKVYYPWGPVKTTPTARMESSFPLTQNVRKFKFNWRLVIALFGCGLFWYFAISMAVARELIVQSDDGAQVYQLHEINKHYEIRDSEGGAVGFLFLREDGDYDVMDWKQGKVGVTSLYDGIGEQYNGGKGYATKDRSGKITGYVNPNGTGGYSVTNRSGKITSYVNPNSTGGYNITNRSGKITGTVE